MSNLSSILLSADYSRAPFFAVLDGAQFDNLPDALREGKFVARSLYLDRGENNPEQVITAPHLVLLDETARNPALRPPAEVIPALLRLLEDRPAAVFWQCPGGEEALFRHLRGINMVLYPKVMLPEEPIDPEAEENSEEAAGTHTLVLFRHADANVMAQVAPVLSNVQTARLLGPALGLVFVASDERGGFQGLRPSGEASAPAGPLRLEIENLDVLDDRNLVLSRLRLETHLKEVAPEYVQALGPGELTALVARSEASGDALGIQTEYGHGLWATLVLMTAGAVETDPQFGDHITAHPDGPDRAVEEILEQIGASTDADWEAL